MADRVKAAVMTAPHQIKMGNRLIKHPGPGEVELRVGYVAICGTDLHNYFGGDTTLDFPSVFGHEFSAQVIRCGDGVQGLEPGQWVGVAPLLSCGDCSFCITGNNALCKERIIFGAQVDGALRERLTMPAENLFPLPSGVSPQEGALAEPLAVAIHAVNQAGGNIRGKTAIISGSGAIGLLIALLLEAKGADHILLLEIDEKRLAFAHRLGFQAVHPNDAPSSTADCLFIATGASEAIAGIPGLLAPLGVCVVVGNVQQAKLNWLQLLFKEGSIMTSRYFTFDDYQQAINLLNMPGYKANTLIEDQVDFSDLFEKDGKTVMERAKKVMRLLIKL